MAEEKDMTAKIKDFLGGHLKDITESSKVRFREIQKAVRHQFGKGLFMPELSRLIKSIRPDLAKPARKAAGRRGRTGRRGPGRPPGRAAGFRRRGPGRPPGTGPSGMYLVKVGRKLSLARSRDRVQSLIDKMVASGQSLARLRVFSLSPVGIATRVEIG